MHPNVPTVHLPSVRLPILQSTLYASNPPSTLAVRPQCYPMLSTFLQQSNHFAARSTAFPATPPLHHLQHYLTVCPNVISLSLASTAASASRILSTGMSEGWPEVDSTWSSPARPSDR